MKLKLAGIIKNSVVDGPGLRTVVFAQGCPHRCIGCHNPQTQDSDGGYWHETDTLLHELCADSMLRRVTISGGEPFLQAKAFALLAASLKQKGIHIMTYTGFTYEELAVMKEAEPAVAVLLASCDILVDGRYIISERDLSLAYRGSRNQRIIDVPATLRIGKVVLSPLHFRGPEKAYA